MASGLAGTSPGTTFDERRWHLASAASGWGANDHNLNAGKPGTGNIIGRAIFVGGAKPKTYAGYRLAAGSSRQRRSIRRH